MRGATRVPAPAQLLSWAESHFFSGASVFYYYFYFLRGCSLKLGSVEHGRRG